MRCNYVALACFLVTTAGAAFAQAPTAPATTEVTGVIKSVTADQLVLTTPSGDVTIGLGARVRVLSRQSGALDDIKPGVYLGTTNLTAADGVANRASEVHVMASRGAGGGVERQMDPQNNPALMMTNGHVTAVTTTASGREMDVDYGGTQTRHVVVTQETTLTRLDDIGVAGLRPGLAVMARTTPDAQGHAVANLVALTQLPH